MFIYRVILTTVLLALLSACGGGGDSSDSTGSGSQVDNNNGTGTTPTPLPDLTLSLSSTNLELAELTTLSISPTIEGAQGNVLIGVELVESTHHINATVQAGVITLTSGELTSGTAFDIEMLVTVSDGQNREASENIQVTVVNTSALLLIEKIGALKERVTLDEEKRLAQYLIALANATRDDFSVEERNGYLNRVDKIEIAPSEIDFINSFEVPTIDFQGDESELTTIFDSISSTVVNSSIGTVGLLNDLLALNSDLIPDMTIYRYYWSLSDGSFSRLKGNPTLGSWNDEEFSWFEGYQFIEDVVSGSENCAI